MERYNIKNAEKKWQEIWSEKKINASILDKNKKNSIALKCFLIRRVKFIWDTLEIIQ